MATKIMQTELAVKTAHSLTMKNLTVDYNSNKIVYWQQGKGMCSTVRGSSLTAHTEGSRRFMRLEPGIGTEQTLLYRSWLHVVPDNPQLVMLLSHLSTQSSQ